MLFAARRDMQKPKVAAEGINLWPWRRLWRKRVMWEIAPVRKRVRKAEQMGMSGMGVGWPPKMAGREGEGEDEEAMVGGFRSRCTGREAGSYLFI